MSIESCTVSLPRRQGPVFLEPKTTNLFAFTLAGPETGTRAIGSKPETVAVNALASIIEPLHRLHSSCGLASRPSSRRVLVMRGCTRHNQLSRQRRLTDEDVNALLRKHCMAPDHGHYRLSAALRV